MRLCVVGCSYRTAPLALRERLALGDEQRVALLEQLRRLPELGEVVLLSTCNRVEVYATSTAPDQLAPRIQQQLASHATIPRDEIEAVFQTKCDAEAVAHIFRVASSLDAMVVGEAQILGQVKRSFAEAEQVGAIRSLLGRCMRRAFSVAKRVRSETDVARHPASVSSVAVDLAARIFEDLSAACVLVVGAGEMAELALTHLQSSGATRLHLANRSPQRAEDLAARTGGRAVGMETFPEQLVWADVVLTSTGSEKPLITRQMLQPLMKQRRQRALLIVDIAVPRDVERAVGDLPNVYLFDIDDMEQVVATNLQSRRREAGAAEKLVAQEAQAFCEWWRAQDVVPLIKQLRAHLGELAQVEAARTARKLGLDTAEQRQAIEQLAEGIANKLLHAPTVELKRHAACPDDVQLAEATRRLFGLPDSAQQDGEDEPPPGLKQAEGVS